MRGPGRTAASTISAIAASILGQLALPCNLEVVDLGRRAGGRGDIDRLMDGREQPVAFAAHVR